jgi:hypothetical protein
MPVLGGIFETPNPQVNKIVMRDRNLQLAVQPVGAGIAPDPSGDSVAFISQKIKAINPVFGSACFVGSAQTPITFAPTFGTTKPPPPNKPISGHVASTTQMPKETVITGTVVDNAFAAPAAAGCGPSDSLDTVVNEVGGLPSAAGMNTAIFKVTVELIPYTNIH